MTVVFILIPNYYKLNKNLWKMDVSVDLKNAIVNSKNRIILSDYCLLGQKSQGLKEPSDTVGATC